MGSFFVLTSAALLQTYRPTCQSGECTLQRHLSQKHVVLQFHVPLCSPVDTVRVGALPEKIVSPAVVEKNFQGSSTAPEAVSWLQHLDVKL